MVSHAPTYESGIVAAYVRMNWRGKPVLQIRRQLMRCGFGGRDEPAGFGPWRDARKSDAFEVAAFLITYANVKPDTIPA